MTAQEVWDDHGPAQRARWEAQGLTRDTFTGCPDCEQPAAMDPCYCICHTLGAVSEANCRYCACNGHPMVEPPC